MFGSPDVHRAGTRRILACPYCNGLQAIPPQPVRIRRRVQEMSSGVRVTEAGAVADVEALSRVRP